MYQRTRYVQPVHWEYENVRASSAECEPISIEKPPRRNPRWFIILAVLWVAALATSVFLNG